MATTSEIDRLIHAVMKKRDCDYRFATLFVLGWLTQYIPSEEVQKSIKYMEA